jgi:hypothetical protein
MMLGVLGFGLLMGLGLPALDVYRDKVYHAHVWIERREIPTPTPNVHRVVYLTKADRAIRSPFWPRYWLHLRGHPSMNPPGCKPGKVQVELLCEFDHPDIYVGQNDRRRIRIPAELDSKRSRLDLESRQIGLGLR